MEHNEAAYKDDIAFNMKHLLVPLRSVEEEVSKRWEFTLLHVLPHPHERLLRENSRFFVDANLVNDTTVYEFFEHPGEVGEVDAVHSSFF